MRAISTKGIACIIGLVLFALMLIPAMSYPVRAEPLLAITSTPQEPAPPTSPPQPTLPPEPTSPPSAPNPTEPPSTNPTSSAKPHESPDKGTPDVAIIKTVDQSSAKRGDLMGFTLHVTNEGTATAKDVVATDTLPNYLDILDYSVSKGSVSVSGHTVTANIGTLSTGEYVTVRFRAYLNDGAPATGSNTGTVTDSNGDSNSNNNSGTVTFGVSPALLSPTPVPPTEAPALTTPEPSAPAPTIQTVVPAPKPPVSNSQRVQRRPATMPNTGDGDDQTAMLTAMLLIGVSGLGIGWVVRRRA